MRIFSYLFDVCAQTSEAKADEKLAGELAKANKRSMNFNLSFILQMTT